MAIVIPKEAPTTNSPLAPKLVVAPGTESRQLDTVVDPAKTAETAAPPTEDAQVKLAELARKEAALVKKMREIAAKEAAQKDQEPELQAKFEAAFKDSLKQRFAEDPLGVCEEYGISTDALTQQILNPRTPPSPEVLKMQQELQTLKQQREQDAKAQEERQSQAFEKAVEQIRTDSKTLIDSDPEKYELIKGMDAYDAVTELIVETYKATGKLISPEESAQQVEEYLDGETSRVANLKKVQAKLKPQDPAPAEPGTTPMKTLTNRVEQTPTRSLTAKQKMENAIAIAEGRPKPY